MKFTFRTNVLAAAFCAAVQANHKDICGDDLDTCAIGNAKGRVSIEINDDGFMQDTNQHDRTVISTLAQLEQAIGDALAMLFDFSEEDPGKIPASGELDEYSSPVRRNTHLQKNGGIVVGCKMFTPKGAQQVVEFAKQMLAGKKPKKFITDGTKRHRHLVEIYRHNTSQLLIDSANVQDPDQVVRLGAILEKFTQRKAKPAPKAQPFRIFQVPKVKVVTRCKGPYGKSAKKK